MPVFNPPPLAPGGSNGRTLSRSLGRAAVKPPAVFPDGIAADSDLLLGQNRIVTTLVSAISATDTAITVSDPTSISQDMVLSLGQGGEIVKVVAGAGLRSFSVERGFDGTTPVAHGAGSAVLGNIVAWHHNALVAEIEAIETALGPNLSNVGNAQNNPAAFYWCRTPGGSLTPGSQAITLSPAPLGVNGESVNNAWAYISGGSGTPEPVPITGYSCIAGTNSALVTVTVAHAHSGAWSICSASAGIQEAVLARAGGATVTVLSVGPYGVHAPIYVPNNCVVRGQGIYTTKLEVTLDFPLSGLGVVVGDQGDGIGPEIADLGIWFVQPDSTNIASYTHWPPAFYMYHCGAFFLENIQVVAAWDVLSMLSNAGQARINNLQASHFNVGIDVDGCLDCVYFHEVRFWPYGLTANQYQVMSSTPGITGIRSGRCDGLMLDNFFSQSPVGIYTYSSATGGGSTWAQISGIALDSWSRAVFGGDSTIQISNFSISIAHPGQFVGLTVQDNAIVQISGASFFPGVWAGVSPYIEVTGTGSPSLFVSNGWFWSAATDLTMIYQTAGTMCIMSSLFIRQPHQDYGYSTIAVTGGRAIIIGNRTNDKGTGTGNFLYFTSPEFHQIIGNSQPGWTNYIVPDSNGLIQFQNSQIAVSSVIVGDINYIADEVGANNAIVGHLPQLVTTPHDGMTVTVQLSHSLAAGASNTFSINNLGAWPIFSSRNPGSPLSSGYAANGVITLMASLKVGAWLDMSQ